MLDSSGFYCSAETDLDKCRNCLAKQEDFTEINIKDWRQANAVFVEGAKMIIGPSYWAADTLTKYFNTPTSHVIPHGVDTNSDSVDIPQVLNLPDDNRINIGILGAIGPVKGARQLERLVEQTRARNLPVRWIVIGYTDKNYEQFQSEDSVFCVHGSYTPVQMQGLLEHYQVKLVVFPSAGPETYCYTLTEAWSAGIPALVPPIGALHERVSEVGAGWLMSDWQKVDAILEDLLEILKDENKEDYYRKSRLAADVIPSSIYDMVSATVSVYQGVVSINDKVKAKAFDKVNLHRALQHNEEIVPALQLEPVVTDLIIPTSSWGRFSLYLRRTLLGRLGALILPVRLKEILKRWMIGEAR